MIDRPDDPVSDWQASPPSRRNTRSIGFALFIAFLALFLSVAGISTGYRHWQRMHEMAKANAAGIATLTAALASRAGLQGQEQLQVRVGSLEQQLGGGAERLQQMRELEGRVRRYAVSVDTQVHQLASRQEQAGALATLAAPADLTLMEVGLILQVAVRNWQQSHDVDAALTLLQQADQHLAGSGLAMVLPLRERLATDMLALERLERPDPARISADISWLQGELERRQQDWLERGQGLPLQPADPSVAVDGEEAPPPAADDSADQTLWSGYKQRMLRVLKQSVVVRENGRLLGQPLALELQQQALLLLQLRLEVLRLLLLQARDRPFHEQIALIRQDLKALYPEAVWSHLVGRLDALERLDLEPEWPDISGSLTELERLRRAPAVLFTKEKS
ncbi:MAG: uroporphyrinogen-III C-methyltransferase [Thiothrix sp.]|nr:uroporphyrinogen-III C-methyltransferase [Thiothrix sp.]HPQ94555.1 uroporphyrinogen-III C-methyltransferase [Thiolinea sp.]